MQVSKEKFIEIKIRNMTKSMGLNQKFYSKQIKTISQNEPKINIII